jgi:hypothetical protein
MDFIFRSMELLSMSEDEELNLPDDLLSGPHMAELGDLCEGYLLGPDGKFDPALVRVRRKRFCQFLGIGESTFTGWVQAGRIPRAAAIALVLYRNLRQQIRQIGRLIRDRLEPRVVAIDGKYTVCEFEERDDGEIVGRLVATGISDEAVARDIARHRSRAFADLQASAIDALKSYQDVEPDVLDWVGEIAADLEDYRKPGQRRMRLDEPLDPHPTGLATEQPAEESKP